MFASMCRQAHIIRRSRHHWQCQHHLPKANIISKKKSTSYEVLFFLEAPPRFELGNKGFADLCLTTWLWRQIEFSRKRQKSDLIFVVFKWSGLRGSNPPPRPWQGRALPNELNPHISPALVVSTGWCLRSELNQRHEDFQSSALPTELQRQIGDPKGTRTPDL